MKTRLLALVLALAAAPPAPAPAAPHAAAHAAARYWWNGRFWEYQVWNPVLQMWEPLFVPSSPY